MHPGFKSDCIITTYQTDLSCRGSSARSKGAQNLS